MSRYSSSGDSAMDDDTRQHYRSRRPHRTRPCSPREDSDSPRSPSADGQIPSHARDPSNHASSSRERANGYDSVAKTSIIIGLGIIAVGALRIWFKRQDAEKKRSDIRHRERERAFERRKWVRRRDEERRERQRDREESDEERESDMTTKREMKRIGDGSLQAESSRDHG